MKDLQSLISNYESITLHNLDKVQLLDRVDSKYVCNIEKIEQIIKETTSNYCILEIEKQRLFGYKTSYFDTLDFDLYHLHQRGKANRVKIRNREYLDSKEKFFEIKLKNHKNRTKKHRINTLNLDFVNSQESSNMLQEFTNYTPNDLEKKLDILYDRITLVNHDFTERVTIDFNLKFAEGNNEKGFPKIVIIEIKQGKSDKSEMAIVLKRNYIYQQSISKYCFGVISLFPTIKHNNFKNKLHKINKINNEFSPNN